MLRQTVPVIAAAFTALASLAPDLNSQSCAGASLSLNSEVLGRLDDADCITSEYERFTNHRLLVRDSDNGNFHITLTSNIAMRLGVFTPDGRSITMWGNERVRIGSGPADERGYARVALIGMDPGTYLIQLIGSGAHGDYRLRVTDRDVALKGSCTSFNPTDVPLNVRRSVNPDHGVRNYAACRLPGDRAAVVRRFTLDKRSDVTIRAEGFRARIDVLRGAIEADSAVASGSSRVAEIRETLDPGSYIVALGKSGSGNLEYEIKAKPAARQADADQAQCARETGDAQLKAMAGNARAMYDLWYMFSIGRCVGRDAEMALHWLQRAAGSGHRTSQRNLANAYVRGYYGLEPDTAEAIRWYQRAAEDRQREHDVSNWRESRDDSLADIARLRSGS